MKKRFISLMMCSVLLFLTFSINVYAEKNNSKMQFNCESAILIEGKTGKVLFEQNADERLPPASVTKVMTLLLVMEAIEEGKISFDDIVTASSHACSMGGSQIYLEEGERMSVEDLLKSVVISSANDAAVALAEYIAGTEEAFVLRMNERAKALEMKNTNFENTNGLDDTVENHLTTSRDIAIMSKELLKYKKITEYSSIWMDTIRNGEFGLTNTNRLIRFYKGATGLKTGSTSKAKFCISASAQRDGMELICVVMAAPTRDIRNSIATSLLDWGFANFLIYSHDEEVISPIKVKGGVKNYCKIKVPEFSTVVSKSDVEAITREVVIQKKSLEAPVKNGDVVGFVKYNLNGKSIGMSEIIAVESINKIGYFNLLLEFFSKLAL